MKQLLRDLQTHFAVLQDTRVNTERFVRRQIGSVHDQDWRAFKHLTIGDGDILDIGANRGQSIDSFRAVGRTNPIVAFEPNLRLAAKLSREYALDNTVRIEPVALSDEPGEQMLFVPHYRKWIFDGLASMDRAEAMTWLTPERIHRFDPVLLTCEELTITVRTLDSFELRPAIVKLDTQGTEGRAVRGGLQTIAAAQPVILLESATPEIVDMLQPLGYRPHIFKDGALVADRLDGSNVFFLVAGHLGARAR